MEREFHPTSDHRLRGCSRDLLGGITLHFNLFEDGPGRFALTNTDTLTGSLSQVSGESSLDTAGFGTDGDDLAILIANGGLGEILIQVGGTTNFEAEYRFHWDGGDSNVVGTAGGGDIEIGDVEVDGHFLFVGHG